MFLARLLRQAAEPGPQYGQPDPNHRQERAGAPPSFLGAPGLLAEPRSRFDRRGPRGDFRAERRAVRAELGAYKHELRRDPTVSSRDRRAVKYAAEAQLWGDILRREEEREMMQRLSLRERERERARDMEFRHADVAPRYRREEAVMPRQSERDMQFGRGSQAPRVREEEKQYMDPPPPYEDVVGGRTQRGCM